MILPKKLKNSNIYYWIEKSKINNKEYTYFHYWKEEYNDNSLKNIEEDLKK